MLSCFVHLVFRACRPERVEKHTVRTSKLAYVIALAGGGAKDVTSRSATLLSCHSVPDIAPRGNPAGFASSGVRLQQGHYKDGLS